MILRTIFTILATACRIYSAMCLLRVLLTWIPVNTGKFGEFLNECCDPFLNFFRKIKFAVIGSIDFSPAIALCVLSAAALIFRNIAAGSKITLGFLLSLITSMFFQIFAAIISFFIIILIIRLILLFANKGENNIFVCRIDQVINSVTTKFVKSTNKDGVYRYYSWTPSKKQVIILLLILIGVNLLCNLLMGIINWLLLKLPI